ncbi:4'-phosphopantetheinyl transferase superfamily protein [Micromonospora sp. WMMD1128]|uniref:4'-phosphopantetheinyl transferase family protein n=1 Tax=Micromonospora sp. WMMD1128 TaxID=3015150 RepID=UPI00248B566B|nr:4'-phosphopantetheinyl transferase superfamily protein [Micromonospora sp. WMMD1128]WBB75710.1 4'-phosphopantetheinyl transferase superfamily protein [Micromonospora sp. WMMD1128]
MSERPGPGMHANGEVPGAGRSAAGPGLVASLLPAGICVVEETSQDIVDVPLFPQEQAVIRNVVRRRREEFTTVRVCARRALARLGISPVPVLPGPDGAPTWPPGVVGSITHCRGHRACAVALDSEVAAVGIDAEPNQVLPYDMLEAISLPSERAAIRRLPVTTPAVHWDRLLFSAKEAIYKVWFPLTGRGLDFAQAEVALRADGGFTARLLVDGARVGSRPMVGLAGRWRATDSVLATGIVVPAVGSPRPHG